ncbi:MAG: hypothetical protein ACOCVJ_02260 [Verrucomicrobiota bacterium]
MAKRTIKINIKLPNGVTATKELVEIATNAAKSAIDSTVSELAEAQKVAEELANKGISITAEELLRRKSKDGAKRGRKKAAKRASKKAKAGARKRVVLTDAQREAMAEDLKGDMKINEAAKKYGVSAATVMNVKTAAGLTSPRKEP